MMGCLHLIGLWGIVLTKLIDVERPSLLYAVPFPRQGVLHCVNAEIKVSTNKQASDGACIHFLSALSCG